MFLCNRRSTYTKNIKDSVILDHAKGVRQRMAFEEVFTYAFIVQAIQVVIALAGTYIVARIVSRAIAKAFEKTPFPEEIEKTIIRISKYLVYLVGLFIVISVLGFDLTSIIVGLGAFSIAISFATSNIIQNFVSGIIVQGDKQFKIGDEIKVKNFEGRVVKIGIRTTTLKTDDGSMIYIPNSFFVSNPVVRKRKQK